MTRTRDALVAALEELKLRCELITESDERRPWTRPFPEDAISLHVVLEGGCLIETDLPLQRYRMHDGEVLLINGTEPGALRGMSDARQPEVVSARVHLLAPFGHPMLTSLPRLIRASPSPAVRSFEPTLHALREEHASRKLGREFAVARLLEVLFVHALRAHIDDLGWRDQGWFRMLADPVLREPLAEASRPATTVAGLAAAAGRSRQRTSARFTQLGGAHPSAFLRQARVRHAAELLRAGETDLDRIATASGYATRQGLCRAFRRELGVTPAAHWRAVHGRPFPRARSAAVLPSRPSSAPGAK